MRHRYALKAIASRLRRNAQDESGAATIEAVLWLPVFFSLLVLAVDVSMIFHNQARMTRVVQDANRALSVGRLSSIDDVKSQITAAFGDRTDNVDVHSSISNGLISTRLSIPAADLDVIGLFRTISGATVTVIGEHFVEY